jgi:hypothetical protein
VLTRDRIHLSPDVILTLDEVRALYALVEWFVRRAFVDQGHILDHPESADCHYCQAYRLLRAARRAPV